MIDSWALLVIGRQVCGMWPLLRKLSLYRIIWLHFCTVWGNVDTSFIFIYVDSYTTHILSCIMSDLPGVYCPFTHRRETVVSNERLLSNKMYKDDDGGEAFTIIWSLKLKQINGIQLSCIICTPALLLLRQKHLERRTLQAKNKITKDSNTCV